MSIVTASRYEDVPFSVEKFDVERPNDPPSRRSVNIGVPGFRKLYEEITPNSDKISRAIWRSFEHYKLTAANQPALQEATVTADMIDLTDLHVGKVKSPYALYTGHYGAAGKTDSGLRAYYDKRLDGGFVPPPDDLQDRINASLRSMMPVIKNELSLVNSLIELKDFASLPRTVGRVLNVTRNLRFLTNPNARGLVLRQLLRSSADSYLQYRFNIAPLISDITGIYRVLTKTVNRINRFIAEAGRVHVKHFTVSYVEDTPDVPQEFVAGGYKCYPDEGGEYALWITTHTTRYVYVQPATFHAQVQYNYNYTGYQREYTRLLSLLDGLGVNINPAIVWNAIPWSFVVDWVLGVSKYLNEQRVGWMDPQINILQYLWSIKRVRKIITKTRVHASKYYGQTLPIYPPSDIVYPVVDEVSYRRQAGLPDYSSFLTTSGLSPTELSLGAALVLTREKRYRRMRL